MRLLVDKVDLKPKVTDVSEIIHDGKKNEFRDYEDESNPQHAMVKRTYYNMHTNQTVDYVKSKREKWMKFNHIEATIMEALVMLNDLVDESDPDIALPNIVHAFQTAERIRHKHPDKEWFHLTGLIHDLGKVMAFYDEPQWAVVGDTFPTGCAPRDSIVYGKESFKDNKDLRHPVYSKELGMYEKNCGLDKVTMSWGHDEYLYQCLLHNGAKIPKEGLYCIRFHSFYPWHTGGDYKDLTNEEDEKMLPWVDEFNTFDLYTKGHDIPDVEELKPYYQGLIDKFIPGVVKF